MVIFSIRFTSHGAATSLIIIITGVRIWFQGLFDGVGMVAGDLDGGRYSFE